MTIEKRSPWRFVPGVHAVKGALNGLRDQSTALFKVLGASNTLIGWIGLLQATSALRWLVAPWMEARASQRTWLLRGIGLAAASLVWIAFALLYLGTHVPALLAGFAILALATAVVEIAAYGFTAAALTRQEQDFFAGAIPAFFRIGTLLAGAALLFAVGVVGRRWGNPEAWAAMFAVAAGGMVGFWAYARATLPHPPEDRAKRDGPIPYRTIWTSYFRQPDALAVLGVLGTYRIADGLLDRMRMPFLLDTPAAGGLGLSLHEAAVISAIATGATIAGGVVGGAFLARRGFRRAMVPLALAMFLPNLLFGWLAAAGWHGRVELSVPHLALLDTAVHGPAAVVTAIDSFGYGAGMAVWMLVFLRTGKRETNYPSTFLAMSASLGLLSTALAGVVSGYVYHIGGYAVVFAGSVAAAGPSVYWLWRLRGAMDDSLGTGAPQTKAARLE